MLARKHSIINLNILSFDLTGKTDNKLIRDAILETRNDRYSDDPRNGLCEDNKVDFKKHKCLQDLSKEITLVFQQLDKRFVETSGGWGHVQVPMQSTVLHTHGSVKQEPIEERFSISAFKNAMSWCYYVDVTPESGDIVFFPQYRDHSLSIVPKNSHLLIFPCWMYHYTTINYSNTERISISGNRTMNFDQVNEPTNHIVEIYGLSDEGRTRRIKL